MILRARPVRPSDQLGAAGAGPAPQRPPLTRLVPHGKPDPSLPTAGAPRVIEHGPDSWAPEFQDPNWDLSGCSSVAVYAKGEWLDVLWCEEQGRLFICDWGH